MDEATKVLIGTFSGFIVAFLAEPVKIYFQNRAKINNLRLAIYKELLYNFLLCKNIESKKGIKEPPSKGNLSGIVSLVNTSIRNECYKDAVTNNIHLFYKLDEVLSVHSLYGTLSEIPEAARRELPSVKGHEKEPAYLKLRIGMISESAGVFCNRYISGFKKGYLDKSLLKKIATPDDYKEIVS